MSRPVGFILAGGRSRRFGSDKAQARVGQRTMLEHVVAAARPVVEVVVVVGGDGPLPPGVQRLADPSPGGGPVQAVVGATRAWPGRDWLLLGCDLPYVDTDLLAWLARPLAAPTLARLPLVEGRPQYLVSYWRAAAAQAFEAGLALGLESLRAVTRDLPIDLADEASLHAAGLDAACLSDVDTPQDLRPRPESG